MPLTSDLSRRGFLLGAGAAAVAAVVPVPAQAVISGNALPAETIAGYSYWMAGDGGLYAVVSPSHMRLFAGEIGEWTTGVRFIEAKPIPPVQFSYANDPNSFDVPEVNEVGEWHSPPSNLRTSLRSTTTLTPVN